MSAVTRILPHVVFVFALVAAVGCAAQGESAGRTVTLLSPTGDAFIVGSVEVVIAVESDDPLDRVELLVDDRVVWTWGEDAGPGLATSLDTTLYEDGAHELRVEAVWADGETHSDVRRVMFDNVSPALEITEPLEGRPVYHEDGSFAFVVALTGGSRIEAIRIRVDGLLVEEHRPVVRDRYVAAVDPLLYLAAGTGTTRVRLSAEAEDAAGRVTVVERMIDIRSRVLFRFDTLGRVWAAPEPLPDDAVAVVTSNGVLHVIDADGIERCNVRADGELGTSSPTYVPGADALVWGTTHRLRVTSAATCEQLWIHPLAGEFVAKPVVTDAGVIHATTFQGTTVAFRPDGSDAWSDSLAARVAGGAALEARAGLAVGPDGVVYQAVRVGATGGALFAIHPDRTVEVAELTAPVNGGVLVTDSAIYFGARDGSLYCYGHDLVRRWVVPLRDGTDILTRPAFDGTSIAVGDGDGTIHGRDPATGDPVWEYDALLDRSPSGVGLVGRAGLSNGPAGDMALGDALGMIHVLAPGGQPRWRAQVSGGGTADGVTAPPILTATRVYVGAENQSLTAFTLR